MKIPDPIGILSSFKPKRSKSDRKSPHSSLLTLEALENRLVLDISLRFDAAAGLLTIAGDEHDNVAHLRILEEGEIKLDVDGQSFSSSIHSNSYSAALGLASAGEVREIRFEGAAGADSLRISDWSSLGTLVLRTDDALLLDRRISATSLIAEGTSIEVSGLISTQQVELTGSESVYLDAASVLAVHQGATGGSVRVTGGFVMAGGTIDVSGLTAGSIEIKGERVFHFGQMQANSTHGTAGSIDVRFTGNYFDTEGSLLSASGIDGGTILLAGGTDSYLLGSGRYQTSSESGIGGSIDVFANTLRLVGARLDASGAARGGSVRVGGDYQGQTTGFINSEQVYIAGSSTLSASSTSGDGGRVIVWSDVETTFLGAIDVSAGPLGGDGGFIEVSSKETLTFGGIADAGAPNGKAGTLLLDPKNIIIAEGQAAFPHFSIFDPLPVIYDAWGSDVETLANGNIVIADQWEWSNGARTGSVYYYNGKTGALISALHGRNDEDRLGKVQVLSNGNFIVGSNRSVTWVNAETGLSGAISSANSLFGYGGNAVVLPNGNYLVVANGGQGYVNWIDGTVGDKGPAGSVKVLKGSNYGDNVGAIIKVFEDSNYLVISPNWQNGSALRAGAVTWVDGSVGLEGFVSAANSLVGTADDDRVGLDVYILDNGNYVVLSPGWDNGNLTDVGAATWGNGSTGIIGVVSAANSLIGGSTGDQIGSDGLVQLTNGNLVVRSRFWDHDTVVDAGAVTWADGTGPTVGIVTSTNSIVGDQSNQNVGDSDVTRLTNGDYLVQSSKFSLDSIVAVGAIRHGSGLGAISGVMDSSNSLVGTSEDDAIGSGGIVELVDGSLVVISPGFDLNGIFNVGAITWISGVAGLAGTVSAANSLVGSAPGDLHLTEIVDLGGGKFLALSPRWDNGAIVDAGAATVLNNATISIAVRTASNSFIGTYGNQQLGANFTDFGNGVVALRDYNWNNGSLTRVGAVTFIGPEIIPVGPLSATTSFIGSSANDHIGGGGVYGTGTEYVIVSGGWDDGAKLDVGAITWVDLSESRVGTVSRENSFIGTSAGDRVGTYTSLLPNGALVVRSPNWDNELIVDAGAITWITPATRLIGSPSASNSLVGSMNGDRVGDSGFRLLDNGTYLVLSGDLGGHGAVTWLDGSTGHSLTGLGTLTSLNSHFNYGPIEKITPSYVMLQTSLDSFDVVILDPSYVVFGHKPSETLGLTPAYLKRTLDTGTSVILQANNDIVINDPILLDNPSDAAGSLTLVAGRSILINADISTDNGSLTLIANAPASMGTLYQYREPGPATITFASGVTTNAGDGNVHIEMGSSPLQAGTIKLGSIVADSLTVVSSSHAHTVQVAEVTTTGSQVFGANVALADNLISGSGDILFSGNVSIAGDVSVLASEGTVRFENGVLQLGTSTLTSHRISLSSTTVLEFAIGPSNSSGQIRLSGPGSSIDLGEASIEHVGFGLPATFTLIDLSSQSSSGGGFAANTFELGDEIYAVFYGGGDGNDIVLANLSLLAGPSYFVLEGQSLALNAISIGSTATYRWDINGDGVYGDAEGLSPTLAWSDLLALGLGDVPYFNVLSVQVNDGVGSPIIATSSFTISIAIPVADFLLPNLGLRTDGNAGHAVRGQESSIQLFATDTSVSDPSADYLFHIDWDGDGTFDEEVIGPSGTFASHTFTAKGSYTVAIQATNIDGGVSETVTANLIVTDWDKRQDEDDPSLVHLVVGGTMGNDAFAFLPGWILTQLENNTYFPTPRSTAVGSFNGQIQVYAQAGDDLILGDPNPSNMMVYGGEGNDILVGGRGSDSLFGGVGDDMIFGGTMESDLGDWLEGNEGEDLLFGWLGGDTVTGGDGEDLIVAGSLNFEDLPEAIYSIQSEWLAPRPQEQRIANLSGTGTGDRFNNDFFLTPGQTVLDDAAVDLIHGGLLQSDWVLAEEADLVTGNPQPLNQVGEEEWVNFPLSAFGFNFPPSTTVLADGTTYVTWLAQTEQGGSVIYVVRQQIDANGNRIGAPIAVATPGNQYLPEAATDAAGNLLVVWSDYQASGDVYFSRYNAGGEQIGETVIVAQPGTNKSFFTFPSIDVNEQGEAVISWNQKNGIFVRKVSAEGVLGEVTQVPGSAAVNSFLLFDVGISETGAFTVVWTGSMGGDGRIYRAQSFDALGNAGAVVEIDQILIDNTFMGYETVIELPRVSMASSGQFVVTWSGRVDEGDYDVYARSFGADGTPLSDAFVVSQVTTGYQYLPSVSANDNGSFVVSWATSDYQGATPGIYARTFAMDGTPLTEDVTILEGEAAAHQVASVGVAGDGAYVVNWHTHWSGYAGDSINGAWVDAVGTVTTEPFRIDQSPQPVETILYSHQELVQFVTSPQSAVNANGDRVTTWPGLDGVFVQVYLSSGQVGPRVQVATSNATDEFSGWSDIAIASNGDFVVAWHQSDNNQVARHFARRYQLDGASIGDAIELPKTYTNISFPVDVHMDSAGNAIVLRGESAGPTTFLMLHRIDTAGQLVGTPLQAASGTDFAYFSSAANGAGEVVISWLEDSGPGRRMWVTKIDATNNIVVGPTLVAENVGTTVRPGLTMVALAEDGSFVVTWESGLLPDGTHQILARRYDAAGNPIGDAVVVREAETPLTAPAITFVSSGAFVVSWREAGEVYLQQFAGAQAAGDPVIVPGGLVYSLTSGNSSDLLVTVVRETSENQGGVFVTRWSTGPALTESAIDDLLADDDLELALAGLEEGLL